MNKKNGVELIALTWTNIDFENRVIAVTKSWGRRYQMSLRGFLKNLERSLILTRTECLNNKFHDLRATSITQMLLKGVPLAKVMKIVGHSTIKTTMRYLRLIAEDTQGATEELGIILPKTQERGNLVPLFQSKG
jgi:integrase